MIIQRHLPEYCYPTRKLEEISAIVVHGISGRYAFPDDPYNLDNCYNLFLDMGREPKHREFGFKGMPSRAIPISVHVIIGRDGTILEMLPDSVRANHAGVSEWKGRKWVNNFSLGVELVGSPGDPYTDAQYASLGFWLAKKMAKYRVHLEDVVGHNQVSPGRKTDPYDVFDWERIRSQLEYIIIE